MRPGSVSTGADKKVMFRFFKAQREMLRWNSQGLGRQNTGCAVNQPTQRSIRMDTAWGGAARDWWKFDAGPPWRLITKLESTFRTVPIKLLCGAQEFALADYVQEQWPELCKLVVGPSTIPNSSSMACSSARNASAPNHDWLTNTPFSR